MSAQSEKEALLRRMAVLASKINTGKAVAKAHVQANAKAASVAAAAAAARAWKCFGQP
jgi:hypothetical protein